MAHAVFEPAIPVSQIDTPLPQPAKQDTLSLHDFRDLIANMPVSHQAFTSKQPTWASHMSGDGIAGAALRTIFGESDEVTLSRSDLRHLANEDLAQFVMATIIWGYPRGMRGNNVANLIGHFDALISLLAGVRGEPVEDWKSHYAQLAPLSGVGLSTHTKFLTFLSVTVHGHSALILDDRILRIAQSGIFRELAPLHGLKNAAHSYPRYLECMHSLAGDLMVSAERLEFFLFEFGLNLKPPRPDTNRLTRRGTPLFDLHVAE
jgi:hypothetical protein